VKKKGNIFFNRIYHYSYIHDPGQLRFNQDLFRERIKKKKEINYLIELTDCNHVHYMNHKFYGLTQINIIYHRLFISFFKLF